MVRHIRASVIHRTLRTQTCCVASDASNFDCVDKSVALDLRILITKLHVMFVKLSVRIF